MNYFNINYDALKKLKEFNYFNLLMIVCLITILFILIIKNVYVSKFIEVYGYYENNILHVDVESELSDKLKTSKYIIFNGEKCKFTIDSFGEYRIENNRIYQNVLITLNKEFYQNEIGRVKFLIDKEKIFNYIFELFK